MSQRPAATKNLLTVNGFEVCQPTPNNYHLQFPTHYDVPKIDEFLRAFGKLLTSRPEVPFTLIADASGVRKTNSLTRRRLALFFKNHGDYFEQHCKKLAIITASTIQKGAITAIFWLRPNNWPTRVFNDPAKAEAWVGKITSTF